MFLSQVVCYWAEKGISGFTVFKYRLKRLEGQPLLTTNQVIWLHKKFLILACSDILQLHGLSAVVKMYTEI